MKKPNKIIAIGDVHLFYGKRFEEHRYIFKKLDKELQQEKPDLILLLGDIVDSKTKLSPEQILLVREFFTICSNHARVAYIIGNHDRTLQSDNRIDSLSSIVSTLSETKNEIVLLGKSDVYDIGYDGLKFAVWSWLENNKSPVITKNDSDYIIGLYHGIINGAYSKDGYRLSGGIDLEEFDKCDIVIAGDIHNPIGFRNGEVNYTSSLVQVSINEDENGYYLVYNLNKDGGYSFERKELQNKYAVKTIPIEELKTECKYNQNLRVKFNLSEWNRKDVLDIIKEVKSSNSNINVALAPILEKKKKLNITTDTEKEQVVEDYFNLFLDANKDTLGIDEELKDKLLEFNQNTYRTNGDLNFELGDYIINSLTINNLLSFKPEDLTVQLDDSGLIGILGRNRAGKSSIIKILQFVLFDELPNNTISYSFINKKNRTKNAYGSVIFEKNGKYYKVTRTLIPKKSKKAADTKINFQLIDSEGDLIEDLNKGTATETNAEIRKYLGLNEYFETLSIFSAQKKQIEFIDCKNADRLKLTNKFLNLQEYEEKEKLVKDDIKVKKSEIDTLEKLILNNYDNIQSSKDELIEYTKKLITQKKELKEIEDKLVSIKEEKKNLVELYNSNIANSKKEILDKEKLELESKENTSKINSLLEEKKHLEEIEKIKREKQLSEYKKLIENEIEESTEEILEYNNKIKALEVESTNESKLLTDIVNSYIQKYGDDKLQEKPTSDLEKQKGAVEFQITSLKTQLDNPICSVCGEKMSALKKENLKEQLENKFVENKEIQDKISLLLIRNEKYKIKYQELLKTKEEISEIKSKYKEKELKYKEKINGINSSISLKKQSYKEKEFQYKEFLQSIVKIDSMLASSKLEQEKLKSAYKEIDSVVKSRKVIETIKQEYEEYLNNVEELTEELNSLKYLVPQTESKITVLTKRIEEYNKIEKQISEKQKEFEVYKLFRQIVSKDGLPLFVLNKKIQDINDKINFIINQVFDFELKFLIDEEKGELKIKFIYPDDLEANEVSLASGSETFLINLCIKVGLSQLSQLPKVNSLFIDEGYDVLDSETVDKLPILFNTLKEYYHNVFTITHLDTVKDMLDSTVELNKINGYTTIGGK